MASPRSAARDLDQGNVLMLHPSPVKGWRQRKEQDPDKQPFGKKTGAWAVNWRADCNLVLDPQTQDSLLGAIHLYLLVSGHTLGTWHLSFPPLFSPFPLDLSDPSVRFETDTSQDLDQGNVLMLRYSMDDMARPRGRATAANAPAVTFGNAQQHTRTRWWTENQVRGGRRAAKGGEGRRAEGREERRERRGERDRGKGGG
jgi:hypothetical protein